MGKESSEIDDSKVIKQIESNTWKIHGSTSIYEVSKVLGIPLSGDYETLYGFVFSELGSIPQDGSTVELEASGLIIKIIEISEHQVEKVVVCIEPHFQ